MLNRGVQQVDNAVTKDMAANKVQQKREFRTSGRGAVGEKAYRAALNAAGVTQDDLALLRELARQNAELRGARQESAPAPARIFL